MSANNKALVHRWFKEVWNQGREATIDELFAHDAVTRGLGESDLEVRGPAQFKIFFFNLRNSFPDMQVTIEDTVAEGDKVVSRSTNRFTHTAAFMGCAPTGKPVAFGVIEIARFANGQWVESWSVADTLGMLQQLGASPTPEQAPLRPSSP